ALASDDAPGVAPPPDGKRVEVRVRTTPRGAIAELLGSDQKGPTPITFQVPEGGPARVRITQPGYLAQTIELDPAVKRPPRIALAVQPWIIRINSVPEGAYVFVDGRRVAGFTPNEFEVPESWHRKKRFSVGVRKSGFDKHNSQIQLADFQPEGEALVFTLDAELSEAEEPVIRRPRRTAPRDSGDGADDSGAESPGDGAGSPDDSDASGDDGGDDSSAPAEADSAADDSAGDSQAAPPASGGDSDSKDGPEAASPAADPAE
ncbi:MAG: PEGA domain-containing protein, partial [Myxococcota bacterium]